jgi:membrane-bound ClpP family serine protease
MAPEHTMSKKPLSKSKKSDSQKPSSPGTNLLLTLTLVPLVAGLLLIGAWALDISIFEDAQSQVTIGILFFLLSFAASNALQKRWRLALGWTLLMGADLVTLAWRSLPAQVVAIGLGLVGVVLLIIEFYNQYRQGKLERVRR